MSNPLRSEQLNGDYWTVFLYFTFALSRSRLGTAVSLFSHFKQKDTRRAQFNDLHTHTHTHTTALAHTLLTSSFVRFASFSNALKITLFLALAAQRCYCCCVFPPPALSDSRPFYSRRLGNDFSNTTERCSGNVSFCPALTHLPC